MSCSRLILAAGLALSACSEPPASHDHELSAVDVGETDVCTGSCDDQSEKCCTARADCVPILGVVTAQECVQQRERAGCMASDTNCGQQESFAADEEGRCWSFPNTCIPASFSESRDCNRDRFTPCEYVVQTD